ncbi:MAG: hypothetical protein IJK65_04755 [Clostridiales bacterium]|nr:hypothetical protein [Clostridiales bacterium]
MKMTLYNEISQRKSKSNIKKAKILMKTEMFPGGTGDTPGGQGKAFSPGTSEYIRR